MLLFQSIVLVSILLTTNAQWYIKKNYRNKFMNYPNPGKRSLPEEKSIFTETDCETSYSQSYSHEQRAAWAFLCGHKKSSLKANGHSDELDFEFASKPKLALRTKQQSQDAVLPDYQDYENSFNKYILKLARRVIKS
ncbi:unnamed protein product [Rotaria socialis]|uniref:Uncharacterized protein n=1 Tax=Rotaria socialis TaxID=392032 RepID=A0A818WM13_9BILA|nr:unnamed protein product [Rotaria socialis]CAF3518491.1 unnamed protein product [Rotaria socialis]CAF3655121.1 unnamed protein product [Rotaria socialis]CAF3690192.1 unnamed protein product [Rotaria socialis]CAF3727883.1 unnamed protein product [Rotaria socialis]